MKKSIAFAAIAVVVAGAGYRYSHQSASIALSPVEKQSLHDAPNDGQQAPNVDFPKLGLDAGNAAPVATPSAAPAASASAVAGAAAGNGSSTGNSGQTADRVSELAKIILAQHRDNVAKCVNDGYAADGVFVGKHHLRSVALNCQTMEPKFQIAYSPVGNTPAKDLVLLTKGDIKGSSFDFLETTEGDYLIYTPLLDKAENNTVAALAKVGAILSGNELARAFNIARQSINGQIEKKDQAQDSAAIGKLKESGSNDQ
jgi:hypothetical protein